MTDLFAHQRNERLSKLAPLADRLRPRTLDEFVGQEAILGPGRLLRRAIAADRVGNLILHGPPGVGKTTLARIIAGTTRAHFSSLNAVLAGVKDLRAEVEAARERLAHHGRAPRCSSMRCTASTPPSRTPCCPGWRTAP